MLKFSSPSISGMFSGVVRTLSDQAKEPNARLHDTTGATCTTYNRIVTSDAINPMAQRAACFTPEPFDPAMLDRTERSIIRVRKARGNLRPAIAGTYKVATRTLISNTPASSDQELEDLVAAVERDNSPLVWCYAPTPPSKKAASLEMPEVSDDPGMKNAGYASARLEIPV